LVFPGWTSSLGKVDDEFGFPSALVQFAMLLEGSGLG